MVAMVKKFNRRKRLFIAESRIGQTETNRGTIVGYSVCYKDGKIIRSFGVKPTLLEAECLAQKVVGEHPWDYLYP